MLKKILIVVVLSIMVFQGAVFAAESEGEIVFKDALYGAAIGALFGVAIYAVDDDNFSEKVGAGVIVGTFGGLFYGLHETRSFAEIKDGKVKLAVPVPVIQQTESGTQYSASLLKAKF